MKNKYTKIGLICAAGLFALNCATGSAVYHGYMMKGSVVSASGTEGVICVGSKDGAAVGQTLKAYKITSKTSDKTSKYVKTEVGSVKITEIVDEHFAKVTSVSGKLEAGNIVEVESH